MEIKIKRAKSSDWKIIQRIQKNDGFKHAYYLTKKRILKLFKRGEIFYLAFLKNKAVAFTSVDFEIRARLHFISVLKEFHQKGIGSILLNKIVNDSKKEDIKVYILSQRKKQIKWVIF